jgi:hypothetical protein
VRAGLARERVALPPGRIPESSIMREPRSLASCRQALLAFRGPGPLLQGAPAAISGLRRESALTLNMAFPSFIASYLFQNSLTLKVIP